MALFNKIFSTRRKIDTKNQDNNICSKLFTFTKDQVRIVLYRECDFRGRKLLFDSSSIEKVKFKLENGENRVPLPTSAGEGGENVEGFKDEKLCHKNFVETYDNFGYVYTKPMSDVTQLGELIFGSVAMSFRGTTYKIHSFNEPKRLMYTQVFPSPRKNNGRRSLPMQSYNRSSTTTSSSLEQSVQFDDSGTSSTSFSENLSVSSTASDTLLVCRKNRSVPLDVPNICNNIPKLNVDSGYSCEQFYNNSSFSSGPASFPTFDTSLPTGSKTTFSCGSLYKRWLRSTNNSLEHSTGSLQNNSNSTDELLSTKSNKRSSKLGLAIIIKLTDGEEEFLEKFLMEHSALLESLVWRARQGTEAAYLRHNNFLLLMSDVHVFVTQWLFDFLTGPYLNLNLWLTLSNCDNNNSGSSNSIKLNYYNRRETSGNSDYYNSNGFPSLLILTKFFNRNDDFYKRNSCNNNNRDFIAEKFVKDFCELLETIDVKHTNFFMSTLITAVLTHHLGWVTTVLPTTEENEKSYPGNPLWGQLIDLYGATGHPTKVCHTIITGCCDKNDLITKILNTLTYFIRCNNITKNVMTRTNKVEENVLAERICVENLCMPKENFKKYEDHLRESSEMSNDSKKMKKTNTFLRKLDNLENEIDTGKLRETMMLKENLILKKDDVKSTNGFLITKCEQKCDQINDLSDNNKVVFLLGGDNEKLIGLNKEKLTKNDLFVNDDFKDSIFKDSDFLWNNDLHCIKPSTSCQLFVNDDDEKKMLNFKETVRSQSVPRDEDFDESLDENKRTKYRYSGVKFNFQQYPEIFTNYMKINNLELSSTFTFEEKEKLTSNYDFFNNFDADYDADEPLQTPSNATELEFTSDLIQNDFEKRNGENTLKKELEGEVGAQIVRFPMPKFVTTDTDLTTDYTNSLMRGLNDHYISHMVLQGISAPRIKWESALKRDLILSTRHPFLDQPIDEAVAVIANKDTWEVLLMSSHKYVVDKGNSGGIRVGMSQLVANMLESLLRMWKLRTPPEHCLLHIERKLQELFIRSKALAQLLLATEFCSMELLTSTLQLEINDVPLIMAIASTHTPQIMQKYGLSFQ